MFKKVLFAIFSLFLASSLGINDADKFCFRNENNEVEECVELKEKFEFFIDTYNKKYEQNEYNTKFEIFKENFIRVINDKSYLHMNEEQISKLDQKVQVEL
jgi:hypothetical protein